MKSNSYNRLLAIDPSLTSSGWAILNINTGKILGVGTIKSLSTKHTLAARYLDLQLKIKNLLVKLKVNKEDVLICESQTTIIDPKAAYKVEQVRGIFEVLAREFNLTVPGRINPRTVQFEALGFSGFQIKRELVKAAALETVLRLFKKDLINLGLATVDIKKNPDIVDAILVGYIGVIKIKSAISIKQPLEEFFDEKNQKHSKTGSSRYLKLQKK